MITRPDDHTGSHIHYFAAFPYTSIWGSLEGRKTPEQKLSFKQALLSHMLSTNAFHSANLSCFLISIFPPITKLHFLHLNTHTTHNSYNFSDEGLLHLKRQLLNSTQWPIYIINSVNNTKLPCYILPLS